MIKNLTNFESGYCFSFKFTHLLTGFFFFSFLIFSGINAFAQQTESAPGIVTVCPYGDFDGHHHTPAADWILENAQSPAKSFADGNPCSLIDVTYIGFPPAAEAAFQAAVDIWESVLSSPVTIRVQANWTPLGPQTLGSAGPANFFRNFPNAPTTDFYAAALADQIAGVDLNPGAFDIVASFNSSFSWYLGTDGNTPFNQVDLLSTVLHELGHGLGFISSSQFDPVTGTGVFEIGTTGFPLNYDNYLTLAPLGTPLLNLSGVALGDALTSNNVYNNSAAAIDALGGAAPRHFAPSTFDPGSSISHWNEATFLAGDVNSLMTSSLGFGEAIHNPGDITIGLLEDMGWTICGAPVFCPNLGAVVGEPCDDGAANTIDDIVTEDCICVGTLLPAPPNDFCNAAEVLTVNAPGQCFGNEILGTTLGATSDGLPISCEPANPDVFYSFNSGSYTSVQFNFASLTVGDLFFTLFEGGCNGAQVACGSAIGQVFATTPFTDYVVRLSTNLTFGNTGSFTVCIEGIFNCPDLSANIGDSCDDENPSTIDDVVTAACTCAGTLSTLGNDNCFPLDAAAVPFFLDCGEVIEGTTVDATVSVGLNALCNNFTSTSAEDVWYLFQTDGISDYTVTIDTNAATAGSLMDAAMFIYSGGCGALTEVACADENFSDGFFSGESITLNAPASGFYYVRVYNWNPGGEPFAISLTCEGGCSNPFPAVAAGSLSTTQLGNAFATAWDPVPGQIGCQIQVRLAGGSILGAQIIGGANADGFNIPFSALQSGTNYEWRVRCGCSQTPLVAGPFTAWQPFTTPGGAAIASNPNPTPGPSNVTFTVAEEGTTTLEVFDMSGRLLDALFTGVATPHSDYRFMFDGSSLPNGVYIYRLTTEREIINEKFMIAR